jgi:hypothetical protein
MALIASPQSTALICGQCGARFELLSGFDRRLPVSVALAAGWGTARDDKGDFDYACPDCLTVDRTAPPAVPDDPPLHSEIQQVEGSAKSPSPSSQSAWKQPTEPIRNRRRRRNQLTRK